jgi:decaprenyl-phosphate phosphoribosyltransferase
MPTGVDPRAVGLPQEEMVARHRSRPRAALALVRPPHWVKNLFVLAPLLFSKTFDDSSAVLTAIAAFVVFCMASSLVYVINDWCDRYDDAGHPTKRSRPFAARDLDRADGAIIGLCLALAGVGIGWLAGLPLLFWVIVALYVATNVMYSVWLRAVPLVDIAIIAAGFVMRVLAGSAALAVEPSEWIVLATGLLALLLALGKRRVDLGFETVDSRPALSGYSIEFIDAALAAMAAAVIGFYSLFTVSDYATTRYRSSVLYITTFWVVIGVIRYLQVVIALGNRGSPTEVALFDRTMQVVVVGWLATFIGIAFVDIS